MTNPFEDENGVYHVLINDEGQHSLWPSFIQVPEGWTIIHQSATRAACLEFINQHWTDMDLDVEPPRGSGAVNWKWLLGCAIPHRG